jgi:hypothetical protein
VWAKKYERCINCGETRVKHVAKGLCARCYSYQYAHDPQKAERVKEQKRQCYFRSGGFMLAKREREKRWFDSKRETILAKAKYRCSKCKRKFPAIELVVHHKDGEGRGSKRPNNDDSNLVALCRACHIALHRPHMRRRGGSRKLSRWARKHDFCAECGTTAIKHVGYGLCRACYAREKRKNLKI